MKNTYTTPADFWQVRDFGAKISAAIEFLKVHWKPLGRCLLYFVLPVVLAVGVGLGILNNSTYDRIGRLSHSTPATRAATLAAGSGPNFTTAALVLVGGLLVGLLLLGTVYGYLRARLRLPATEAATPRLVWAAMRERLGSVVLAGLVFMAGYLVLAFTVTMVIGAVAQTFSSTALLVLGVFGFFGILAYLLVTLSLYFPVLWLEDVTVLGAFGRCFSLIKGRWWATFGLLLVAFMLQIALSLVFALPQYAVLAGKVLQLPFLNSDVLGVITTTIGAVGQLFVAPVLLLTIAFQYFNLSEEQEGFGLSLLIDELGQPQAAAPAASHHYRPEEEQY